MSVLGKGSREMNAIHLIKTYCLPTLTYGIENQGRRTHRSWGSYPPTFLHRVGQGVQKLMTIIHVFKHVMYFLAFHKLNVF